MTQDAQKQMNEIAMLLDSNPDDLSRGQVSERIDFFLSVKIFQRSFVSLVDEGRVLKIGKKKR